ncbi:hypothetical protein [Spiroplasma taiwanense]|uniref:hypothetical protein n=1 Tax=Spiroplasma taiwanense TaxID=2145 RepID=UPI0003FB0CB1|nr:hypothetical protein [Spiroplasma taiwanense]
MNLNEQAQELSDSQVESDIKEWYKLSNKEICGILETNQHTGLSLKEVEKDLKNMEEIHYLKQKNQTDLLFLLKLF